MSETVAEKLLGLLRAERGQAGNIEAELATVPPGDPFVDDLRSEAIQLWNRHAYNVGGRKLPAAVRNRLMEIVAALRTPLHVRAHDHSIRHRSELETSSLCGCFHCVRVFATGDIEDWIDEDANDIGQTALCPHCGIDSVIGDASGYPVEQGFLRTMRTHWF